MTRSNQKDSSFAVPVKPRATTPIGQHNDHRTRDNLVRHCQTGRDSRPRKPGAESQQPCQPCFHARFDAKKGASCSLILSITRPDFVESQANCDGPEIDMGCCRRPVWIPSPTNAPRPRTARRTNAPPTRRSLPGRPAPRIVPASAVCVRDAPDSPGGFHGVGLGSWLALSSNARTSLSVVCEKSSYH